MAGKRRPATGQMKRVESLEHGESTRKNIPTAELQSYLAEDEAKPKAKLYPRNPDLDPRLVWRGKDDQDREPLKVDTVPIYIEEKIHPKAIVESTRRRDVQSRTLAALRDALLSKLISGELRVKDAERFLAVGSR